MLRLHVAPPLGAPIRFSSEGEAVVIGRSSDCDLVVPDRFLSRRHTRLFRDGDRWMVEDLRSRNGTMLNGIRVEEPMPVAAGDRLQLSGTVVVVEGPRGSAGDGDETALGDRTILLSASQLVAEQTDPPPERIDDSETARRYTERLRLLHEVHRALARPIELAQLLSLILDRAFDHLSPESGKIILRDPDRGDYEAASRGGGEDELVSQTLLREVVERGQAALVLDVGEDERFHSSHSIVSSGIRSLVAAPLLDEEGALGMIVLSSRLSTRKFSEEDLALLASLASVAALRIRNVALAEEAVERRQLEEEVRLARAIQQSLLPDRLPQWPGWEISAGNLPSRGISGDLHMVHDRQERGECVIVVADVSGKGIAAALLTASLEALIAGSVEAGRSVEEICARVSARLFRRTPAAKYATAFVACLDLESGRLGYANAGHNPALALTGGGELVELHATGVPLGLLPDAVYEGGVRQLEEGDSLILYTDGITEAVNDQGEEYGQERLQRVAEAHVGAPSAALRAALEEDLAAFVDGVPAADDQTLLVLARLRLRPTSGVLPR